MQLVGSQGVQSQKMVFVLNDVAKEMDVQVVRYAASMVVDTHAFIQVIIFLGEGNGREAVQRGRRINKHDFQKGSIRERALIEAEGGGGGGGGVNRALTVIIK